MEEARTRGLRRDSALPSVRSLAKVYGVAKATIERTVRTLIKEGICYSVPGKGVFLAQDPPEPEKETTTIGVVFGYQAYRDEWLVFYRQLFEGLQREAIEREHNLLSLYHWKRKSAPQKNRELSVYRDAATGFIALGIYDEQDCLRLRDSGLPTVALDYDTRLLGIDCVLIDDAGVMEALCKRVLEECSGTVFYADHDRGSNYDPSILDRREAYERAMADAGRNESSERNVFMGPPERHAEDIRALRNELASGNQRPAVICSDDVIADRAVRVLREEGFRAGDDFLLAYLGPAETPDHLQGVPALRAAVDFEEMGRAGVELLDERIARGPGRADCRRISGKVVACEGN